MAVLVIGITDPPAFDKKSSEVAYLENVLNLIALKLRNGQGNLTGVQNVLGSSGTGVPNTVVATFTHVSSASIP